MNGKTILALVGLLLLLSAGAGAAYLLGLSLSLDQEEGPVDEVVAVGEVGYVRLTPIEIPLQRRDNIYKYLTLEPSLEVPEGTNVSEIRRRIPRLRDAFVREVNSRSVMRPDGSGFADIEDLKRRLLVQARYVLRPHEVNEVLLNNQTGQIPKP